MSQIAQLPLQGQRQHQLRAVHSEMMQTLQLFLFVSMQNMEPLTKNNERTTKETRFAPTITLFRYSQTKIKKKLLKDKQITPTPEHATPCRDKSASVLGHWQWPTVCVRLFLDRKRNRKRVQSRTGGPSSSLMQVQRWGDRKVLWHWCSGGWRGETAVWKWATRAWFLNKCTPSRVVSLVREGQGFIRGSLLHLDLTYLTAAVWILHKLLSGYEKLHVTTQLQWFVRQK